MPARRQFYELNWELYFKCKDCWIFKTAECYSKHIRCFMWITNICKECEKKRHSEYYKENKEEVDRKNKERWKIMKDIWNENDRYRYHNIPEYREKVNNRNKKWRKDNEKKFKESTKRYYNENRDKILLKNKEYYEHNKEWINKRNREYWNNNREYLIKKNQEWKKNNRELANIAQRKYRENRWKEQAMAHREVEKFMKDNWIVISECPICWEKKRIIAHHPTSPDYSKWNIVVFCCDRCHSAIHSWKIECPKPIDLLTYQK